MNKIDIQSQTDKRKITIDKVGVKRIQYPIIVEDRANNIQHTVAELDIFVELAHCQRGTHMSRFIEVLNHYHEDTFITKLDEFLKEVKKRLKAEAAYTLIRFPYFIKKTAPVSKITSLMSYDSFFEASIDQNNEFVMTIGVKVPITSLCPCSKAISKYGAHNQRSIVTLKVKYKEFVWLEELIEYVEKSASCELFSLLKREDEKFVTEKAYENPLFVEDIVRDLTVILTKDKRILGFEIESENFESIHNHSAYAGLKRDL